MKYDPNKKLTPTEEYCAIRIKADIKKGMNKLNEMIEKIKNEERISKVKE